MVRALILSVVVVSACSTPTTYDQLCVADNDGKEVSVRGTITTAPVTIDMGSGMMLLLDDPNSAKTLSLTLPTGSGPNQMEDPGSEFTADQVRIHAHDGSVHPLESDVTITATLDHSELLGEARCRLKKVTKIEGH